MQGLFCLIKPFECSIDLIEFIYTLAKHYAAHIVLVAFLSAVTFYRREMSCNHVYVQDKDDNIEVVFEDEALRYHENQSQKEQHCEDWDQLLEKAGTWGSGEAILNLVLLLWEKSILVLTSKYFVDQEEHAYKLMKSSGMSLAKESKVASMVPLCSASLGWSHSSKQKKSLSSVAVLSPICMDLSPDTLVYIFSYLHPKDVLSFACCDNACHQLVDNPLNESSLHIWKLLWKRDYDWLITMLLPGRQAQEREKNPTLRINKVLYFEFGQTYLNYILAGHSNYESCLVGIHGNIYDLSNFLEEHPGSPETLLVHAGRDATQTFEAVNHSRTARIMSKSMCVTIDLFCSGGCGVWKAKDIPDFDPSQIMKVKRLRRRQPATLKKIRARLQAEEQNAKHKFLKMIPHDDSLTGDVNVYYNAFERKWKGWYIDTSFQTQYLEDIKR